ncbi:ImmA/IrrE family metallo-endopeptidase [Clostridium lacusfryxellense]|uniref:ImmA/IrrE family metallo-endopeptidase n=1 Tax=Clostridium lacusfryxellense TaxID=205328 RepID=UPI001C0BB5C5|nr:ImmA/IrrE family metallo-endopeptidase [Clostridium lacusfryxellense]MBU3113574.1 ImmA/IrrE family metallo-endopeptidase [Clostridium lacusfryxellense]
MTGNEIVEIAIKLKIKYKSTDPFKIAAMLKIDCNFVSFSKHVVQAYILRPHENLEPFIFINSNFDKKSQQIFCAHELGHAILHNNPCNHFDGNPLSNSTEHEANLFAIALLFNPQLFNTDIEEMNNYTLKAILDHNVSYT